MNHVPYATAFAEHNVRVTINTRLKSVRRECNGLVATLGSDFLDKATIKGRVAQVVVEHGTVPMDDLYRELKPLSRKLGGVDYKALLRGENTTPQKTSMPASTCSASAMPPPAATSTRAFTMPTRRSARLTQSQGGGAWHRRPLEGVLNSLECYDVTAAAVRYPAASAAPVQ
ncbi:hypothetical protein BTE77_03490 [Ensifer adhaerens]|nr:hypothetical protein ASE71_04585 [Ensifer sp. Root954]OKP81359.1 hypothetical protein BTE77_03490 [Ensifer adhaerens]